MMRAPPLDPGLVQRIRELIRGDPREAHQALEALPVEAQVALICETPAARRVEILQLLPQPERVIPELPEAELCFSVKAIGLHDAGWILEHASAEQIVACVDLDVWDELEPSPARLDEWFEAFSEAGEATVLRAAKALDPELLTLWLAEQVEVLLKPSEAGWTPPTGAHTIDGCFYWLAREEANDLATVSLLLQTLFQHDYWFYFRILQGVVWELRSESEEWALRWRAGRLQDFGFPPREEAIEIYAQVPPDERANLPPSERPAALGEWHLPVWMPELPTARSSPHLLFRAAAELAESERRAFFYAFVALANKVAVADGLPLGDAASIPAAVEKASSLASRGLAHLAAEQGLGAAEVLGQASLTWLCRVGSSLDREGPGS
jgi:hypothetical protein